MSGIYSFVPVREADNALKTFIEARYAMRRAIDAMALCAETATTLEARRRYDAAMKQMTRLSRSWNRIEEERERPRRSSQSAPNGG